jgi:PAS domain S-box-containing protein
MACAPIAETLLRQLYPHPFDSFSPHLRIWPCAGYHGPRMRSAAPHLASFPEHNPNPIVETDMAGHVRYANPAARALFPEMMEQGPAHPWLADWPAAMQRLREPASGNTHHRVVVVGERTYYQTLRLIPEEDRARIYGLDITDRAVAEAAAREAHARTSAILDGIADAFYSLDDQWRFVAVNPAAERAPLGRPASELLGKVIGEVFPKLPGTPIHQHYLDAVVKRSQEHYEAQSPLNGRWYEVFMFPRSEGLDVYLRDVDDRKKAEAALKASEERFRTLANNAQDSIARFDREGRYVFVNPYIADRLGLPAEAIVGRTAEELGRNLGTAKWEERVHEVFQTGTPLRFDRRSVDGRWHDVQLMPELREGAVETVLAISRDITDRKQFEEALRESEATLSGILNAATESIWLFSVDGIALAANRTALERWGSAPETVIGKSMHEFLSSDLGDSRLAQFREVARTGRPVEFEDWRAGIRFEHTLYPVFGADGGLDRIAVFSRDVTETRRIETALRESEEHLRLFIDHAPASLAMFDREMRYLSVSRRWLADYRLGDRDIRGLSHYEVFPEIGEDWKKIHERGLAGEVVRSKAERFPRADGSVQWVRWEVRPWLLPSGAIGGIVIFTEDITEATLAAEVLRRYELLASQSRDIVLFVQRQGGRILEANAAALEAYGYTREEILSLTIQDLRAPDTVTLTEEQMAIADERGILFETIHRHKDGNTFPVEVSSRGALVDGERTLVSVVRDISERKRLERLYAVLSQVNEAIVRTRDETTLHREVCRIVAEVGDFPLAWIGMVEGQAIVPVASGGKETAYLSQIHVEVEGVLGAGPTGTCVRENRPVVNNDFAVNPSTSPWRSLALGHGFRASAAFPLHSHGKTIGALTLYARRIGAFDSAERKLIEALCADLSYAIAALEHERERTHAEEALRAANAQLLAADQHKNEFLAVLSHELRNPLAPIRNSLFVLDRADPHSEQAKRAREIIGRQTGQMARLVDDLLDVTRISHNKIQLQRIPLDLNDLVRRTVDDHHSLFEGKGIVVETSFAAQALPVDGDRARLAQIVGNLLQNAAKYTPMGQKVKVVTVAIPTRRRAGIRIIDTGVGIEPAVLRRLFQPFMQATATLDRSQGGLGLGLALVKGLVELHGGEVCAHSDGPGMGSKFIVELPLKEATPDTTSPDAEISTRRRRRVLIVEDNLDAAQSLREVLEFGEHLVEVAHSGPEGVAKARQFRPEVVLCDIGLPGMDGYGVARTIRSDETLAGVLLVALSGYALPEDLQRAWEAGFDRHIAKPPSLERLEKLLGELIGRGVPRTGL